MYTVKVTVIPAVNCRPCVSCTSWVNILAEIRFLEATENLLWEGGVRGEDMERNEIFMPVWAVDPWLRMKRGSRLSLEMGPTVNDEKRRKPRVSLYLLSLGLYLRAVLQSSPGTNTNLPTTAWPCLPHPNLYPQWTPTLCISLVSQTQDNWNWVIYLSIWISFLSHVSCLGTMAFSHQDPPSHQDHWSVWVPHLSFSNSTTNSTINQ